MLESVKLVNNSLQMEDVYFALMEQVILLQRWMSQDNVRLALMLKLHAMEVLMLDLRLDIGERAITHLSS